MKMLVAPILVITVGLGWLLTTQNLLPGVNWIWVLGMGVSGLLILLVGGINRSSIVLGPFLIIATIFSLLRQTGRMSQETEVPVLVILLGVLMLIARLLPLSEPAHGDTAPAKKP